MATISGTIAVVLPLPHANEVGSEGAALHSGPISTPLPKVAVAMSGSEGIAMAKGGITVTLPRLTPTLSGSEGVVGAINGVLSASLKPVQFFGLTNKSESGTLPVTLKRLSVTATGQIVHTGNNQAAINCSLKRIRAVLNGYVVFNNRPASIQKLNNTLRSGSDGFLIFQGPANKVVQWAILSGGGTISPFQSFTDANGYAQAKYTPGAYLGDVQIQVTYGT